MRAKREHYFGFAGEKRPVRDAGRSDRIRDIEFAARVIQDPERLELLRLVSLDLLEDHFYEVLRSHGRDDVRAPRKVIVLRAVDGGRRR